LYGGLNPKPWLVYFLQRKDFDLVLIGSEPVRHALGTAFSTGRVSRRETMSDDENTHCGNKLLVR
jgi:hypothetical protein